FIGLPDKDKKFKKILENLNLVPEEKLGEEGYNLLIDSEKIIITANHSKGLFYGVQTLKQIVRGSKENYLSGIKIADWPDYKYRAVSDDISRGPIPTLDFMKYQIRRFSEMKINTFIHYVEHVVKTKSHPEFAPEDGSLTIVGWKEISAYAKKYNIMVVGGFQSFGHFNRILETPEYAHLGESGTLISPMLDESYKFLEDIYSEMIPAFDSPFFNINCDETFDLGKESSKALVDSIGYDGVYFQHIMKLYNIVKKYNKRVIMWGDILLEHPNLLEKLPKDIIIGTWTYDPKESFKEFIEPIKNAGFEFWVVPGVLNSYRLFPNYYQAPTNIKNFSADGYKYGASGLMNCVWDDGGSTLFTNAWYGVSYGADKSWNTKSSDSTNFDERFNKGIYSAENNYLTETIHKLTELAYLEPTDGMFDKILFAKTIPDEGKHTRISLEQWDEVLKIIDDAEKLLEQVKVKNYQGDIKYLQYVINLYRSLAYEKMNLIEAAELYNEAENIFKSNPFEARMKILNSLELITYIIESVTGLKDNFEILWLQENHTYALDWTTDKYIAKINDYVDVRNKLFSSLKKLDSSESILTKEETRLAITKLPGKYFREWMMINPIVKKDEGNNSKIDYLLEMGGEANAEPKVTQEFYYDSIKYRWGRVVTEYSDIVNLTELFPEENKNVVMYAFANINSAKDTTIKALAGSDDGIEVFINGKSVLQNSSDGKLIPDAFSFSLPLKKGKNNLLLKITQTDGEWGFTFRLPDSEVRNSKNRYRIVDQN
ncbi:MAG: hypothetical protein A2068_09280, partial [Ignavibacteria bacterium GWB2_35_6b]